MRSSYPLLTARCSARGLTGLKPRNPFTPFTEQSHPLGKVSTKWRSQFELHVAHSMNAQPSKGERMLSITMRKGQRYRCQNPGCRAEIEVITDSVEGTSNPSCCCGTEMKKPYSKPVLRRLDKNSPAVAAFFGHQRAK